MPKQNPLTDAVTFLLANVVRNGDGQASATAALHAEAIASAATAEPVEPVEETETAPSKKK